MLLPICSLFSPTSFALSSSSLCLPLLPPRPYQRDPPCISTKFWDEKLEKELIVATGVDVPTHRQAALLHG
ncbi:hypothetical protein SLEP1_g25655 [Rubroshorea leprosula]|uniref:Uncharacterized protein n=1 Tax=Rubroshorea leprosula TaxID=152421 RepID=A0AAV5JX42_9ROSI|nr:hypothetical protein SLEP1_g25655 [Rubroshorea leprosula]